MTPTFTLTFLTNTQKEFWNSLSVLVTRPRVCPLKRWSYEQQLIVLRKLVNKTNLPPDNVKPTEIMIKT